jgi:hypothetical protein
MADEPKPLGRLFQTAIIISIPPLLITAWGVCLGGWPTPGQVAPVHPRFGHEINEMSWRERKSQELNDPTLWNEKAAIVLLSPPSKRAEIQEQMIKDKMIDESTRLRPLTPAEQVEMEKHVRAVQSNNAAMRFGKYWLFFGMPLSLLAMLLSGLAFISALWRRIGRYRLAVAGSLALVNGLVLLLTYWNACGTSLD